ncbi:hypothetical protein Tco_1249086, partial [Tanacetum coccineum]
MTEDGKGGFILMKVSVIKPKAAKKTSRIEIKAGGFEFGSCCGYGCQDKRRREKQHGVNIMAVEVQIGWLWTWPKRWSSLESLTSSEVEYPMAISVFWAIEAVYQESFAHCLKEGNKVPQELQDTCERW